jgi:hypothetical protein
LLELGAVPPPARQHGGTLVAQGGGLGASSKAPAAIVHLTLPKDTVHATPHP